MNWRTKRT